MLLYSLVDAPSLLLTAVPTATQPWLKCPGRPVLQQHQPNIGLVLPGILHCVHYVIHLLLLGVCYVIHLFLLGVCYVIHLFLHPRCNPWLAAGAAR